jgi:Tol biopolymer transport system component
VSGPIASGVWGIWTISTVGGELRKLQPDAAGAVLSPDGSRIAFLKNGEIWEMGANGEEPKRLVSKDSNGPSAMVHVSSGQNLSDLNWSPDGRWLTYLRRAGEKSTTFLEACLLGTTGTVAIYSDPVLRGYSWLDEGHIVLNRLEAPNVQFSNVWGLQIDPKKMKALGDPRRLTNWAGFTVGAMSASKDGQRLAITKESDHSNVFVGELFAGGEKLIHVRRFTTEQRADWPGVWAPDSTSLLFETDRTGRMSIFQQRLQSSNPESVLADENENRSPSLSPDGQWVLYLAGRPGIPQARIMRIPISGGSPELIIRTNASRGLETLTVDNVPAPVGQPAFRCPGRLGAPCVLSEATEKETVFSSFDPLPSGPKTELFRIATKNPNNVYWDLSPDGSRVAYGDRGAPPVIHVRELKQAATRDISIPQWPELLTVGWSADGGSLFATNFAPTGSSLLHISLDGKVDLLYKSAKDAELPKASPDGHYLAFGAVESSSNVWLIEGIPK